MKADAIRSKHVVLIAHYAPWLLNFRASLLLDLRATQARVTVVAPGEHPEVRMALLGMGIDYRAYPLERTGLNPGRDIKTLLELRRILVELQPTHVLTTAIKPNIYGTLAARAAGVQHIFSLVTGLGYAFTGTSSRQRRVATIASQLYKIAFQGVEKVIFQNPDDRDLMIERGLVKHGQTALVAGSGVDLKHYSPQPVPDLPPIIFVMVARLIREKGIFEYAEAARILHQRKAPVHVRLAGPLDENPTALKLSELEKLTGEGILEYLGELNDVRPALREGHVFVLPSYREGTPRSTLEALATGRAVITTDAPGCRETVIEGQNGLLVPIGDAIALADAMQHLSANEQKLREMASASLELARKKFDVRLVNASMLKIMGISERD